MTSADLSADHRPIVGRPSADCQNPKTVGRWKNNYNKVVIIYFCRPMKKELKSGILSADKSADLSADGRPTVFWVNVIAVLYTIQCCLYYVRFLLQNMCISSHCTIAEHAYGTCLNGYANRLCSFQQFVFVCDKCTIWGKLKSKRFEI